MNIFTTCIQSDPEYLQLLQTAERNFHVNPLPILASGLCDGASDAFLIALIEDTKKARGDAPALVVCPEEKDCVRLCAILEENRLRSAFYMARDLTFYNITASHEYEHERLRVLSGLLSGSYDVVVTTPDATLGYTVPKDRLRSSTLQIDETMTVETKGLAKALVGAGYVRTDLVDSPGQFAIRGGIADVYPPHGVFCDRDGGEKSGAFALRIELFGNEIDRMGLFDPDTQRMTETVSSASFPPARELLPDAEGLATLQKAVSSQFKRASEEKAIEELIKEKTALDNAAKGSAELHFLDKYISLIYPERASLLDYFDGRTLVCIKGTNAVWDRIKASEWHLSQTVSELLEGGTIASKHAEYAKTSASFELFCDRNVTVHVDSIAHTVSDKRLSGLFGFRTRHTVSYLENEALFLEDLEHYTQNGYRCLVLTENEVAANAAVQKLSDKGFLLSENAQSVAEMKRGTVRVLSKNPIAGFELIQPKVVLLTMGADARSGTLSLASGASIRKKKKKNTKSILSYAELEKGDYVVHETYGIGPYTGIETLTCQGITRES
ncbi:MAG: hypothetical protein IJX13_02920, partial [Clostridia bacterium]|nr:hypothetical protein [Clostridia bacterium]